MTTLGTPAVNVTMGLVELAYAESDPHASLRALGWADSLVLETPPDHEHTFTVEPTTDDQEGSVLIIAVRVPHPDTVDLAPIIRLPAGR
jgi:hypothetical protein